MRRQEQKVSARKLGKMPVVQQQDAIRLPSWSK